MVFLCLFCMICIISQIEGSVELIYPLTSMDRSELREFGIGTSNAWKNLMNGGSIGEYRKSGNYKWSNKLINIVDGVEYKNFGQFVKYIYHFRKLLKKGSADITQEAVTTVINTNSLSVHFCFKLVLNLDIGIYDASTQINKCATRTSTFDDDMVLIKSEMSTDSGFGGTLFNYALQSTITTIIPAAQNVNANNFDIDDNDDDKLWNNPVFMSLLAVILSGTLLIGVVIGCVVTKATQKKKGYQYFKTKNADSDCLDTTESDMEQNELLK